MTLRFYLHGSFTEGTDTLPGKDFSFVLDSYRDIEIPSFLIWFYRDTNGKALLAKIRRTTRPADLGIKVYVTDPVTIQLYVHGLLDSVYPDPEEQVGLSPKELANELMLMRDMFIVPDDKSQLVKDRILRDNRGTVDESYFTLSDGVPDDELFVEAADAYYTGFRLFGLPRHEVPPLREEQVLASDLANIFAGLEKGQVTADGKHVFKYRGRRLYLQIVDRTPYEATLGVDFIYNFLDERRAVFVQYKCQKRGGKYYRSGDESHDFEVARMSEIPGLGLCPNLTATNLRLCRCPVFVKLCKREIAEAHDIPLGVYHPLCLWKWHVGQRAGLSIEDEPHFNNQQFQQLVKTGLIGSTPEQTQEIERHLIGKGLDARLKLIFEEERIKKRP